MRPAALLSLASALVLAVPQSAAADLTLTAEVGLGGVCRPGRWAPVRVTLQNTGTDVAGDLLVEWGDSRVSRAVALTGPSRQHFELYIRASDVRAAVRIALRANGRTVASLDVPVRLAGYSEVVNVALSVESAPRSWRGYDAVDRVEWTDGSVETMAPERRDAFAQWQAFRQLEEAEGLEVPTRVYDAGGMASVPVVATFAYAVLLIVASTLAAIVRRPRVAFVAIPVLIACSAAAAIASDSLMRGDVVVRHHTVIHDLPGTDASLVSMRGIAVFPAFDAFALRPLLADATIDADPAAVSRLDENGEPVLAGEFGLGARQSFSVEGTAALRLIASVRAGGKVRISNVSGFDLRECQLSTGYRTTALGAVRAAASADVEIGEADTAVVSCLTSEEMVRFADRRRGVRTTGTTRVFYRILPAHVRDDRG